MQEDGTFEEIFSERLRDLYARIQSTSSKPDRILLMQEFAQAFADEYDASDFTANESFHKFIEDFEKAKLAFQQASFQMARMGLHFMASVCENEEEDTKESKPIASTERRLN